MVSMYHQRDGLLDLILQKNRIIDETYAMIDGAVSAGVIEKDLADILQTVLAGGDPFEDIDLSADSGREQVSTGAKNLQ